jgi:predicted Rossmann fold nucleotide-binding protein DprA/Smf involved in DNA uptake
MRLLAAVYPMPMTADQIAYEIGISIQHAYVTLDRMRLAGRAVKCGPALYGSVRIQP